MFGPRQTTYTDLSPKALKARASFAQEWLDKGRIMPDEKVRLEEDADFGVDSGPVKWIRGMEPK